MSKGFEHNAKGYNRHHIIARGLGGTNHPDNIKVMEVVKHRALHILHGNNLPVQQLIQSVEINSTALSEEFRYEVEKLLDFWKKEGREAYKEGIIKKNREI